MLKSIKKRLSFVLSVLLLLSMIPAGAIQVAAETTSYKHSTSYNSIYNYFYSNKKFPTDYAENESYFTYLYGSKGSYQEMKKCYGYYGWTNNYALGWSATEATYPGVNSWFMATTSGNNSVIDFHARQSGEIKVTANSVYAGATGIQMMIVQRRGENYYPIYPDSSYAWKDVPLQSEAFSLDVTTTVEVNDEILIIAGGTATNILCIDPIFTFTGNSGTAIPNASFTPWGGIKEGTNYQTGWYAYHSPNPYSGSPWTFMHGKDGSFSKMSNFIKDNGDTPYWASLKDYQDPAGAYIKTDVAGAGINDWAVASFKMSTDGYIVGGSNIDLALTGKSATGVTYSNGSSQEDTSNVQTNADVMVVLKNTSGKYYPVYPVAGQWQWKAIGKQDTVDMNFQTAYHAGDELLYIVKPEYIEPDHITNINPTEISIQPSLYFSDTQGIYPDDSLFTDFPSNHYYDENNRVQDVALTPAVISNDLSDSKYLPENRFFEVGPSITVTENGRLFTILTSGGVDEGPDNYSLGLYSDDGGDTWNNAFSINHTSEYVRVFDTIPFMAPNGELWVFYNQSYLHSDGREGVWIVKCNNPDVSDVSQLNWSDPVRLCNGMIGRAPTVLSSGKILMTSEITCFIDSPYNYIPEDRCNTVYELSSDGTTATAISKLTVPDRNYTEAVIVEKDNGELWFLARREWGKEIGSAVSTDGGATWTAVTDSGIANPSSKFDIIRLESGNLLLLNHYNFSSRDHITAMISRDNGATWEGFLSIDERSYASYPDAIQGSDGRIYVVYDRDRYNAKEILLASFTEEDVLAGVPSETTVLKHILDKAMGIPDTAQYGHGGMFTDSDLSGPYSINHSGSYFSYEVGSNGVFEPMNQYVENQWWKAWTYNGADPKVSTWFLSGSNEKEGAVVWHPATSGRITVTSSQPLETDGQGRTAEFMVIQKRNDKFYPIYPTVGEFEWAQIAFTNETFPTLTTTVAADDELMFVVRSQNQIIKLSPQISFEKGLGTQLDDSVFMYWENITPDISVMYLHSDLFAKDENGLPKSSAIDGAYYSYEYGVDGTFFPMGSQRYTSWSGSPWCWTTDNESYPWVAHWNIASAKGLDGAISWHASKDGSIRITSGNEIYSSAGGTQFMILQKRNSEYYPIYPIAGEFEWKTLTETPEQLPEITADVKAGDEIVFVSRSETDEISAVNPCIRFTEGEVETDTRTFMTWQKRDKKIVLCVGDSITLGVGASRRELTSYPQILQNYLGDDYYVINLGSSGSTLSSETDRAYTSRKNYEASLATNPNMVIMMFGTNDCINAYWDDETVTAAKYKADLEALIADYKTLDSKPTVVLMNFPTMYGNGEEGRSAEHQSDLLNVISDVAADKGCKLIDMHTFTAEHSDWFADALHPNDTGYAQIGSFVAEELKKNFAGDVNGDGNVDILDIIRLKKRIADEETDVSTYFANLNDDEIIDALDLGILKKILMGIDFFR